MKCVIDGQRDIEKPYACDQCVHQIDGWLADIAEWWPRVPEHLERGRGGGGQKVAGSREAPLPFNPVVFDLVTPWPNNRDSAVNTLSTAVRDWCETFAGPHTMPADVPQMATWLRNRLGDAQRKHPALDEFHGEIRTLRNVLRRVVGETDPKPELCPAPCKKCDLRALVKLNDGSGYVRCSGCGLHMTEGEYDQWTKLLVAHLKRGKVAA